MQNFNHFLDNTKSILQLCYILMDCLPFIINNGIF